MVNIENLKLIRIYAHRDEFYEVVEDYKEDILDMNNKS